MNQHVFAEAPDGLKFVGEFDALYREQTDPWEQSATSGDMGRYYAASRRNVIEVVHRHKPDSGLEVGCGFGWLTAMLQGAFGVQMTGMDISPTAVVQAQGRHPNGPRFVWGDILVDNEIGQFGAVIWAQMLWYVLEEIDDAVRNTLRCLAPGGLFIVSQGFLREQRYGRYVANGFHGTARLFVERYSEALSLIEAKHDDSDRHVLMDGLLVFRVI